MCAATMVTFCYRADCKAMFARPNSLKLDKGPQQLRSYAESRSQPPRCWPQVGKLTFAPDFQGSTSKAGARNPGLRIYYGVAQTHPKPYIPRKTLNHRPQCKP